ncbi:Serine hydrolase FSH [Cordyceps fumosorosea ARSEF 2679]|uniref:Serine hydrolase FSH n=1 Tax=Cordyceps fumosorosea (strain ARSEF 2679) TaxID=1081104 RepID=A0A167Q4K4_CORFA|nr:Serine hydrolase FSH [Cordyceps fumosorosea ARSEF 2679]OAA57281.1 Serine hydrolase FSH [Cordyceps fumosorosea ARSEF 2679]
MGEAYDPTLRLPRILCLHGGGTNARIFRIQCRQIAEHLRAEYRLVFVEAPFPSEAGPDVVRVFAGSGPFKRWLRFGPSHPELASHQAVARLDQAVQAAVAEDDERGGSGEWTALLGFSQGAKLCASLLYRQQNQAAEGGGGGGGGLPQFRFGVLIAGRGPLVSLEPARAENESLPSAADLSSMKEKEPRGDHVLTIPTIHMHGLKDPGLEEHRRLCNEYCHPGTRSLIVWDAGHRLPVRTDDVIPLVEAIRRLARETAATNQKVTFQAIY